MNDAAEYYPVAIDLRQVRKDRLNAFEIGPGTEVVVLSTPEGLSVIRDLCTHMGGPLSAGRYCKRSRTIACPWHGYVFSLATGELVENPNEAAWAPLRSDYRTFRPERAPKYRLISLRYEIDGDRLRVLKERAR